MSTATDEFIETFTFDLDADLVCSIPSCDELATHVLVAVPCRHPGNGAACTPHAVEVLRTGRALMRIGAALGQTSRCSTCHEPTTEPFAEMVAL